MKARESSTLRALIVLGAFTLIATAIPADTIQTEGTGPTHYQTANIAELGTAVPVAGAATLFRTHDGLSARIATSELDVEAAYTVWWVLWNKPELCSAPCNANDLGIPGNSVFYAAGFVTGMDGTANVAASIDAGKLPEGIDVLIPGGLRSGNGLGAEVHLVIRSHGAILPGSVAEQIGTFMGGCSVNACEDQQGVVFLPIV